MKIEKNKIILYLCIVLAAQILIYALFNIFSSQNIKSQGIGKQLLSGLKKENITSLEIKDSVSSFIIGKKDKDWVITSGNNTLPGDAGVIDPYIDQLIKLQSGVIIYNGSDASSDNSFGFDEKKNQLLTVKTKNKNYMISIGNPGTKRTSSYIKYNNEKKVREVSSNISSSTSNSPGMWAIKNIFESIKFEDIVSCEITSKFDWFKGKYKVISNGLSDKDLKCTIDPAINGDLQDFALENVLRSVLNLTISEYKLNGSVDGKDAIGNIKLTLKNNKEINADIFISDAGDPGKYIVKESTSNYLYLINEDSAKTLFKNTKDFLKVKTK